MRAIQRGVSKSRLNEPLGTVTMDTTTIIGIAGFAILTATTALQTARAAYYLGKFEQAEEELKRERDGKSGWEDEAKFWRNVAFPEAEAKRIENE